MNKELEQSLNQLSKTYQEVRKQHESAVNEWWDNLSDEHRQNAFYAVCQRIHRADLQDQGSYRYGIYDVFGFDPGMYGAGMDCGYMDIHNTLGRGLEREQMDQVTKLVVTDPEGREYTNHLEPDQKVCYDLKDDGQTLVITVQDHKTGGLFS